MSTNQKTYTIIWDIPKYNYDELNVGRARYLIRDRDRVIMEVSARVYRQMKKSKRQDLKYCDRKVKEILQDGDSRWWPAQFVWDVVNYGSIA